jgi:hypothetical protein
VSAAAVSLFASGPFAPPVDAYQFSQGEVFRIIVAAIKGKTVVFLIENNALPADQFPSFLSATQKILNTLRFD